MADSEKMTNQQQMVTTNPKISNKTTGDSKNNKTTEKNLNIKRSKSPAEEYDLAPPDGGWGWLILFGSMLINILVPGTIKSFGVLFTEFQAKFTDATPTAASWIPALCYFLYSSLGPVSSILSVKYSYRTVTLAGGTCAALGMILSFWAASVKYLYFSYGILVGVGAGLSFPPTVYIVTSYFVRLRGLANGLCISGSAFGSIILPPLLRFLLETYGVNGAILIMGGITLNTWVAALFYDPVEQHMIRVPKNQKALEDIEEEEDEVGIVLQFQNENDINSELRSMIISDENLKMSSDKKAYSPSITGTEMVLLSNGNANENNFVRSASAAVVQNVARNTEDIHHRIRKISTPVKMPQRNQTFTACQQLSSTSSLYAVPEGGMSSNRLSRMNMMRASRNRLPKRSPSTSSFQYVSTPFHGSTLSIQPKEFSSRLSLSSTAEREKTSLASSPLAVDSEKIETKSHRKFFDLSLLKDPIYLIILISNSTNAISYTNFIILLPSFGESLHFDKDRAAYLISIVSATDLIGRIGGSALSDTNFIPKTWYFVGGLTLSGVSLFFLPFSTTYGLLSFWCAAFGLASGTYVGITAVIMADMLGTERIESSYGISLFVNGILQLIGPPICSFVFVQLGSYAPLFSALGIILLAGAGLWIFMPFINRKRSRQAAREAAALQKTDNALLES